jgi:hypothetical protein
MTLLHLKVKVRKRATKAERSVVTNLNLGERRVVISIIGLVFRKEDVTMGAGWNKL